MSIKKHIVGNWKMNQSLSDIENFFNDLPAGAINDKVAAWIAPQGIHIKTLMDKNKVLVGAQNCCENNSGAFTGELSPEGIKDFGAHFVIIAHSERRNIYGETSELINKKVITALNAGLTVIHCVGEKLEERETGITEKVIENQLNLELKNLPSDKLDNLLIAYEPVWAIGTGKTATPEQAQEVHAFIRSYLKDNTDINPSTTPILYGGSVKPANAKELLSMNDIDGALVGGASLKGESYGALLEIASEL